MLIKFRLVDGKIPPKERAQILEFLGKNNDRNIRIELLNADSRSLRLNSYYWGVFLPTLVNHWFGLFREKVSPEWMNEELKKEFCYFVKDNVKHVKSTKTMNINQMLEYFTQVDKWSVEQFGKGIPKPNDVLEWNEAYRITA